MKTTSQFNTDIFKGDDLEDLFEQFSVPLRNHSRRVAICVSIIAEYAEEYTYIHDLPHGTSLLITMHLGGMCHDIGKLILPSINDEANYKRHPEAGAVLLEENKDTLFDNDEQAAAVIDMVRYHHERPDGMGFPYGKKEKKIPFPAGICAIADWLDNSVYEQKEFDKELITIFDSVPNLAGRNFCESAIKCYERAKPRVIDQYKNWNRPIK